MNAFEALAVDNRRKIISLLSHHKVMTATDICQEFNISPPAVSQHLKILRQARLVKVEKNGQQRLYRIDLNGIQEIDHWLNQIKQEWEDHLDNLNNYVKMLQKKGEESND